MINLLFITNNSRAELVCSHFQQQLKVRIDLVADFDQGLKAVFEQRPSVVCIQEQIASVTGESVARHIQMLLGADAPAFVLLHEGASKAKPVPRLFEHLVDLSDPFEQVSNNLCQALQQLLANYRELLCPTVPQAVAAEIAIPLATASEAPFAAGGAETTPLETFPDLKRINDFSDLFEPSAIGGPPPEKPAPAVLQPAPPAAPPAAPPPASVTSSPAAALIRQPEQAQSDTEQSSPPLSSLRAAPLPQSIPAEQPSAPAVADEDSVPVEELLQAVEETYLRRKRLLWFSLVGTLLLVAVAAAWWFWSRLPASAVLPVAPHTVSPAVLPPKAAVQNQPSSATRLPSPPRQVALPAFVAAARRDPSFDNAQPGWSRFLTDRREYRLFYEKDSLQAVQVLALGGNGIATAEIRQVVQELTGSDQYQVKQQSRKQGVWVQEAAARKGNAGLLIYRTAQRGPISAFVIARTP